jgi:hypothetical protein
MSMRLLPPLMALACPHLKTPEHQALQGQGNSKQTGSKIRKGSASLPIERQAPLRTAAWALAHCACQACKQNQALSQKKLVKTDSLKQGQTASPTRNDAAASKSSGQKPVAYRTVTSLAQTHSMRNHKQKHMHTCSNFQ